MAGTRVAAVELVRNSPTPDTLWRESQRHPSKLGVEEIQRSWVPPGFGAWTIGRCKVPCIKTGKAGGGGNQESISWLRELEVPFGIQVKMLYVESDHYVRPSV